MTRRITYANELAISQFALNDQVEDMVQKAKLAQAILGQQTLIDGFACTPTGPASLSVSLAPITMFSVQAIDTSTFGSPPTTTPANPIQILKLAYNNSPSVPAFVPPTTSGFSRNDLIEIQFVEGNGSDVGGIGAQTSLPFWAGTNGQGVPNNPVFVNEYTQRITAVVIQVKAGVAAATGTQVTPTPDAGFTGVWVITTANGQTQITSGNITQYNSPAPPFITEKLTTKISAATANGLIATAMQTSAPIYAVDTGAANAYVASLSPALAAYVAGTTILLKVANTNTGASTLNVNGLGAVAISYENGNGLGGGELVAGMIAELIYDGTVWQLKNPLFARGSSVIYLGGAMIQFGTVTLPATGTSVSSAAVTFPQAFSGAPIVTTSYGNNPSPSFGHMSTGAFNITSSGFTFDGDTGSTDHFDNTVKGYWIAIGV